MFVCMCPALIVSIEIKKLRFARLSCVQITTLLKSQGEPWKGDLNHLNSVLFFLNHTVETVMYGDVLRFRELEEQHK